jgi:hypothetical protein
MDEEYSFGAEGDEGRLATWGAFTAGLAGVGTGVFLPALVTFVANVDVDRMGPDDVLVLSGTALALAERGRQYVVYLPTGGSVTLDLSHTTGSFQARWFDPSTGVFQSPITVSAGASLAMTAPASDDWTLYLRRTCAAPQAPAPVTHVHVEPADTITWDPVANADGYDTIVGDLYAMNSGAGIGGSLRRCLERNGPNTATTDPTVPAVGEGFYYLVRARSCAGALGSYGDSGTPPVEPRNAAVTASSNDCP